MINRCLVLMVLALAAVWSPPVSAFDTTEQAWRAGYIRGWQDALIGMRKVHPPAQRVPQYRPQPVPQPRRPAPVWLPAPSPAPKAPPPVSGTAPLGNIEDACAILAARPGWGTALAATRRQHGVSPGFVLSLIRRESTFNGRAKAKTSSALGYAQAIDSTWSWYRKETRRSGAKRTNFADAADFIGWYVGVTKKMTGTPVNDVIHQSLAYRFGQGGLKKGLWRRNADAMPYATKIRDVAFKYDRQLSRCLPMQAAVRRYDQTVMARRRR